ncbi:MAG: efflux RND transporter permease subunit, partial [Planctomycetes bacterium]|nr:efflux RND transporter permease subunit [Planctomycetota bacterium]
MSIPRYVLARPVAALTLLVAALVLGLVSLARLPVAYLPEIEGRSLTISASYRSSSPEEVERTICRPLEEELASLTGLESLSATARADGATISVELEPGADPDRAALEVRERIDRARPQLPPDLGRIEVRRWRSSDRPVFRFRLAAGSEDEQVRLPSYVDEVLVPRLARLEGVSSVEVRGLTRGRVLVDLSRERLAQAGLTARDVTRALQARNRNVSAGQLRTGGRVLSVRILGELGDAEAVAALPLGNQLLGDLGVIRAERAPKDRVTHLDGREALTIRVSKESGTNSVEVCDRVESELETLRESPISAGYRFEVISNDSKRISARLRSLEQSGLFGGLLLCGVLFLFLRRLRPTLVVATTIPCSVIGSFALIYLLRQAGLVQTSLNVVSMMGLILGIGLVVDNGIVVLENIVRLRDEGLSPFEAAAQGASEVSTAITASVMTSLIVFVPMLVDDSQSSAWTRDLAIMVCATVFASLFAALTVVPLLAAHFPGKPRPESSSGWAPRLYGWLVERSLRWRWAIVLLVLPLCGWQIQLFFSSVEKSWGSGEVTREIDLRVQVPRSFGPKERKALFSSLEGKILAARETLDLRRLTTNFALRPDAPSRRRRWGGNSDRLELLLNDGPGKRPSLSAVRKELRGLLPEVPGVVFQIGGGGRRGRRNSNLVVEVSGRASRELVEPARRVAEALGNIEGIEEVQLGDALAAIGVEVTPKREVGARFGVTPQQVGRAVASSLSERAATRLRTRERGLEVVVRLSGAQESGVDDLRRLGVRSRR